MLIDWNYNMTISEVIDTLERNKFSKQQYNDLILSYHIQRLLENNDIQVTPQTNDQRQTISTQIEGAHQNLSKQFDKTNTMFQQIQYLDVPQLNDSMNQVTQQQNQTRKSLSNFRNKQYDKLESKQISNSELEYEFQNLSEYFEQYKQNFKALTNKLMEHKQTFEEERKNNISNVEQLIIQISYHLNIPYHMETNQRVMQQITTTKG